MRKQGTVVSALCATVAAVMTMSCTAPTALQPPAVPAAPSAVAEVTAAVGVSGSDFTLVANSGALIPTGTALLGERPNDWGCNYDKKAGLMWEVKTASGLRSRSHTYTWYDSNASTNGGGDGTVSGGSCAVDGRCDTEKFVQDANAARMCGYSDWRMPSIRELNSLVLLGVSSANGGGYFPNTASGYFWSASPVTGILSQAWTISFIGGTSATALPYGRDGKYYVRLVRDQK